MVSGFSIQRTLCHPPNTNRAKLKRKTRNQWNVNPGYVTEMRVHHLSLMNASSILLTNHTFEYWRYVFRQGPLDRISLSSTGLSAYRFRIFYDFWIDLPCLFCVMLLVFFCSKYVIVTVLLLWYNIKNIETQAVRPRFLIRNTTRIYGECLYHWTQQSYNCTAALSPCFAAAEMEDRAYCIVCQVFYAVLSVALSAAFCIFSKIVLNWGWNAASP